MNQKYIFIVILIAISLSYESYARHTYKAANEKQQFEDKIQEEEDYNVLTNEVQAPSKYSSELNGQSKSENSVEMDDFSSNDIDVAISALSNSELKSLNSLFSHDQTKRDLIKIKSNKNRHNDRHFKEIEDSKTEDYDEDEMEEEHSNRSEKKKFNCKCKSGNCIGKAMKRSNILPNMPEKDPSLSNNVNPSFLGKLRPIKRFSNADPEVRGRIKAKIDYLKEKAKRDFDEESPQKYNKIAVFQPLFRDKRHAFGDPQNLQEAADNPQSPQHIRLLEESFPNPESSFRQSNDDLVRIKRDDH